MLGKNGLLTLIGLIALLLLVNACSDLRKLTYPENITYIEKNELHDVMQRMSVVLAELDQIVAAVTSPHQADRQVLAQLEKLDLICAELEGGNTITNHSVIDDNIEQFRNDIAHASLMVSAMPSNYYYAGKLSGSCTACHQYR